MPEIAATPLTLTQIHADLGGLFAFGLRRRLAPHDIDLGYVIHSWLTEVFTDLAPSPFSWTIDQQRVTILGYTHVGESELRERHARAEVSLRNIAASPDAKQLPSQWPVGQTLAFRAQVCPIRRLSRKGKGLPPAPNDPHQRPVRSGAEIDAWQHHLATCQVQNQQPQTRDEIYRTWFIERWDSDAAELLTWDAIGLQRLRMQRRGTTKADGSRPAHVVTLPSLTISGRCRIRDGDAFTRLLAHGVGRHRAFGFGMILVKAA